MRRTKPDVLLLGVQAPAEPRQTHDGMWQSLVEDAWTRSQDAAAAGQPSEALLWLERAHRMAPGNGVVAAALAGALLQAGDPARAADLFRPLAHRDGMPEAWAGLAASHRMLGEGRQAIEAMAAALRCSVPSPLLSGMAAAIVADAGLPGWCGLDGGGVLHAGPARPGRVRLDDAPVRLAWTGRRARLPPAWTAARLVHVEGCLGSPLPVAAFLAVEGFVEAREGGLTGWAWHPADPSRQPVLLLDDGGPALGVAATEPADGVLLQRPMARPWAFSVPASAFAGQAGAVSVRGADGRHLLGSPVDSGLERRAAAALARAVRDGAMPAWADAGGVPPAAAPVLPAPVRSVADIVIPVYRGLQLTLDCIASVLATVPRTTRVVVVDDASPEPELAAALQALHRRRRIRLIRHAENRGFPAAANAGLRACAGRDAVLLNSDTLVPPGWLERLRAAAHNAAPDIGTAHAAVERRHDPQLPGRGRGQPGAGCLAGVGRGWTPWRRRSERGRGGTVDVPSWRRLLLVPSAGLLGGRWGCCGRTCFAQGYGEENDFCLRARATWAGGAWLRRASSSAMSGAASFGAARRHLVARNLRRAEPAASRLRRADPGGTGGWRTRSRPARRRMDELRWAAGRQLRRHHGCWSLTAAAAGWSGWSQERCRQGGRLSGQRRGRCCGPFAGRLPAWRRSGAESYPQPVLTPCRTSCRCTGPAAAVRTRAAGGAAPPAWPPSLRHRPGAGCCGRRSHVVIHDYAGFCPRIALVSIEPPLLRGAGPGRLRGLRRGPGHQPGGRTSRCRALVARTAAAACGARRRSIAPFG